MRKREREQCKPLPSVLTGGKAVYLKYQKEPVSKEIILVGLKKFFKYESIEKRCEQGQQCAVIYIEL